MRDVKDMAHKINTQRDHSMAWPIKDQARVWGVVLVVFFVALWFAGSVLLPFLVGGALAYFLDPVADRLERAGLSRVAATAVITLVAILVVVLLVLALVPTLIQQSAGLIQSAPAIAAKLQGFLIDQFPQLSDESSAVRMTLGQIGESIQAKGATLIEGVLSSALGFLSAIVFMIVVPVVTFYMLLDWDHMVAQIDKLLPRDHAPVVRRLALEIDSALAAFVRGQVSVCLLLGTFYSIALMVAGLQFGLLVGAIAGAITFIPYVGSIIGGALAIGLALFQFWGQWVSIGLIIGIFAIGQFVEGNILTPKLVGKSVGLHPVWLMFALSVFGALFGFVGLLVAVPVSAAIAVLMRFGIEQYKASLLYMGQVPKDDGGAP
jgi:predicted PurR-regulated permease PerM